MSKLFSFVNSVHLLEELLSIAEKDKILKILSCKMFKNKLCIQTEYCLLRKAKQIKIAATTSVLMCCHYRNLLSFVWLSLIQLNSAEIRSQKAGKTIAQEGMLLRSTIKSTSGTVWASSAYTTLLKLTTTCWTAQKKSHKKPLLSRIELQQCLIKSILSCGS